MKLPERMPVKNNAFCKKTTLNCHGQLLDFSTPKVMGILNITPDSFHDGGINLNKSDIIRNTEKMLKDGADIIDVGGMSSRPGAKQITVNEELERVIPAIKSIVKAFSNAIISIDTYRSEVLSAAVSEGASIINDISAGAFDCNLFETVARLKTPYILMHMKGTPLNMQENPVYKNVTLEVTGFFIEKLALLKKAGVNDIILDPGFGFGKTVEHNYELLKNLADFNIFGLPVMAGISRKSMICKPLKISPADALNGTTALHAVALMNGANILRVHDVKEAKQVIELIKRYNCASQPSEATE